MTDFKRKIGAKEAVQMFKLFFYRYLVADVKEFDVSELPSFYKEIPVYNTKKLIRFIQKHYNQLHNHRTDQNNY